MSKLAVSTNNAPKAIGPYSQAMQAGNIYYLSGQIALDPASGTFKGGDITAQTEQVMKNLSAVLSAAGMDFSNVVKTTIYVKNIGDFAKVNETYGKFLKEPYPARATIEVSNLPKDALVEIEAVAVK